MHDWSDEKVDWQGIDDAASEIGAYLARWGRIGVTQTKEKFGTVRVYCYFGWDCIHGIVWPRRCWIHKFWPYKLDLALSRWILPLLNRVIIPFQVRIYRRAYRLAVCKRPHLREEILCCADFGEALEGVAGYKHSDYWKEVK